MDRQKQIPDADGCFDRAPYFNFNDSQLKFDTNTIDNVDDNYGSASGFLPKSLLLSKATLLLRVAFTFIFDSVSATIPPTFCRSHLSFLQG